MLPWRRKNMVLVEEEGRSKGRSFSYSSILSSLLRSCPSLLPAGPPPWVGRLLHSRRQKVELNKEEPVYTVRYLGSVVTSTAKGEDCTREAVERIWARSGFGEQSVKMNLSVGAHGLRLSSDKKKKNPAHLYSLSRITHCGADPARPRILAWVYRHQVRNLAVVLRCHAALLSRPEQAEAVSVSLDRSSSSAFSEFKRLKRLSDHRHVQTQLLGGAVPLMPLRRVLNGQCHYRTPGDRTLCSITEEEEEEEEERKVFTTSTDPTQLLSQLDLRDIARLEQCQINFVSDNNNNTFTFITSLV